eukprot:1157647-Pelagomonas_calceolata.AAC.1
MTLLYGQPCKQGVEQNVRTCKYLQQICCLPNGCFLLAENFFASLCPRGLSSPQIKGIHQFMKGHFSPGPQADSLDLGHVPLHTSCSSFDYEGSFSPIAENPQYASKERGQNGKRRKPRGISKRGVIMKQKVRRLWDK